MSNDKDYSILKEILTDKMKELERYFDTKIEATDKANSIEKQALEKRLDSMNEFRQTLKDQANKFVTREEVTAKLEKSDILIKSLEISRAELQGKATQNSVNIATLIAIGSILISIASAVVQILK